MANIFVGKNAAHRFPYLAVSTTSDPMKSWKGVLTPFESPDFGFRMGVDKNGFSAAGGTITRRTSANKQQSALRVLPRETTVWNTRRRPRQTLLRVPDSTEYHDVDPKPGTDHDNPSSPIFMVCE